jgi:hypothetical protein
MAVTAPSNTAFVEAYPHFSKAPAALVTSCLAQAARRTSAWLFKDEAETTDAVMLKAAVLLTKHPGARKLELVDDSQAFVWGQELLELQRSAGTGLRVF